MMERGPGHLRICTLCFFLLWVLVTYTCADLPMCKESDYHFEYTECDVLGSRWRVAIPNKAETCTGLPDPVKGTYCTFSCNEGEFLDMQSQQCQKCSAGTYSSGTSIAFEDWDNLPMGFITHGMMINEGNANINCSNSTWTPKGEYVASNTDECTATLSYAVNLKKPGSLYFEYFYPDSNIYFEFFVQNDQCQSTDSESRWMRISESSWSNYKVELSKGNNVLYWRTAAYDWQGSAVTPVLLRNIQVSGVAYTSECFHCKPGTHSSKAGSARCIPCPADTYSNKGATVCHDCEPDKYAVPGSGSCKPRPACTNSDYFYTHTPCDSEGKTQLMYKWIEPKICSEVIEGAVRLPASGEKQTCPPCNPGFFVTNSSGCEPCSNDSYSDGKVCKKCPVGTEPLLGFEYKWWNTLPRNMESTVFHEEFSNSERRIAWEVAGEYIYTIPGFQDTDYLTLTLNVPGYRAQTMAKANERSELSRITFVFETICTSVCSFYFLAGYSKWSNHLVEQWKGRNGKQSYTYLIQNNNTVSFTWTFQRTEDLSMDRNYSTDAAKIYSIHITNVIGGVAFQCRRCPATSNKDSSCVPCPPGHYMANGTGACERCPPNTFIKASQPVGETACVQCGPNTKTNRVYTACLSGCTFRVQKEGEAMQTYDFSPLSNVTSITSNPRFTSRGLRYFHLFNLNLCGTESRVPASCVDNVTESEKVLKGYICQSTLVPSDIRSQSLVSSQPVIIGDSLIGVTTKTTLEGISSPASLFPSASSQLPDVIFYYKSSDATQACKQGRSASVRLRCNPTTSVKDGIILPSGCSEGTCDGCTFHFLWETQHACPLCTTSHYREIISSCDKGIQTTTYVWQQPLHCYGGKSLPPPKVSACVTMDFWLKFGVSIGLITAVLLISLSCYFWKKTRKLQYRYSRLMMGSGGKECELPTADSCAIMEGEDAEDDLMDLTHKSFFTRIKSFSRERTSDGFDSVPLKSSSQHQQEEDEEED
ncbi:endosome/lysosome-associated apoptosis and autophagy regulator 1 [Cyprinodon tularosa]|uniref:endosome/lysosome-associated apoptosis and autophagy regulator 1 n=1 Tax=Cyprinodon tularosa TaxID=77115 RepID=UPI0018E24C0B|nr:endosome/lysosome-associated apoptosis and autophagy regulator 1 [Cyprinodon tularosa]